MINKTVAARAFLHGDELSKLNYDITSALSVNKADIMV